MGSMNGWPTRGLRLEGRWGDVVTLTNQGREMRVQRGDEGVDVPIRGSFAETYKIASDVLDRAGA